MEEKLKKLKKKWLKLMDEYRENGGFNDGSFYSEDLLDQMRAIETTFHTLGTRVQDYQI